MSKENQTNNNGLALERKSWRNSTVVNVASINKLSEEIEMLMKQKHYMQKMLRKAGAEIKNLRDTVEKLKNGPKDYEVRADDFSEKDRLTDKELKEIEERNGF